MTQKLTKHNRRTMISVRLPNWLKAWLKNQGESQSVLIEEALINWYEINQETITDPDILDHHSPFDLPSE